MAVIGSFYDIYMYIVCAIIMYIVCSSCDMYCIMLSNSEGPKYI